MPYTSTKLNTGKMRQRITLVNPGSTQDSTGGLSLASTSPLATVMARIEAITGRDTLAAQQFSALTTHKITIRYRPDVAAKQQVWFKNRVFQISAVLNPDERNKLLYLLCVEVNDSAQQSQGQN